MDATKDQPTYLSLQYAAFDLGVPAAWLRSEAEAGRVPYLLAGRRLLFDAAAVQQALAARADGSSSIPLSIGYEQMATAAPLTETQKKQRKIAELFEKRYGIVLPPNSERAGFDDWLRLMITGFGTAERVKEMMVKQATKAAKTKRTAGDGAFEEVDDDDIELTDEEKNSPPVVESDTDPALDRRDAKRDAKRYKTGTPY